MKPITTACTLFASLCIGVGAGILTMRTADAQRITEPSLMQLEMHLGYLDAPSMQAMQVRARTESAAHLATLGALYPYLPAESKQKALLLATQVESNPQTIASDSLMARYAWVNARCITQYHLESAHQVARCSTEAMQNVSVDSYPLALLQTTQQHSQ